MHCHSKTRRRKSVRLRGYDYSQSGFYFITICTYERRPLFGEVLDGHMILNDLGRFAHAEWENTVRMRSGLMADEFVVMPNHMHAIVAVGAHCMRPSFRRPSDFCRYRHDIDQGRMQCAPTVGHVVRGYKAAVTSGVREMVASRGMPVWQRNYHEHIIRNESAYLQIVQYIQKNPLKWQQDIYHAPP